MMESYEELAIRGAAIADLSPLAEDQAFWNRYALGMALAASVEIERTDGEAFRRERVAFSYTADGPR